MLSTVHVNDFEYAEDTALIEDEEFDAAYPPEIRKLSSRHWTPMSVARISAEFLVTDPTTRVLDCGCGPGKFCIVGAMTTPGHFTGVEQRPHLARLARNAIKRKGVTNARIIHGNIVDVDFAAYDAFYLFNPFMENLFETGMIDSSVEFSEDLYDQYTRHVATQLARAPLGTRLVTYHGALDDVPRCYECQGGSHDGTLKLWEKTRNPRATEDPLEVRVTRNRWNFPVDFAAVQEWRLWKVFM